MTEGFWQDSVDDTVGEEVGKDAESAVADDRMRFAKVRRDRVLPQAPSGF